MKVKFFIDNDGKFATRFEGFAGPTCMAAAAQINKALVNAGVKLDVSQLIHHAQPDQADHSVLRECDHS